MSIGASIDTFHASLPNAFSKPPLPPDWESDWQAETVSGPDNPGLSAVEQAIVEEYSGGKEETSVSPMSLDSRGEVGPLPEAPKFEYGFPGAPAKGPSSPRPPADAYAFYLPFHLFRNRGWGIYLIGERVQDLCEDFFDEVKPTLTFEECTVATRLYLYEHEYFHHKTESFSSGQEASHRENIYLDGQRPLYAEMEGSDDQLEEALAEAYALGRVDDRLSGRDWPEAKQQAFLSVLKDFMRCSGPGYRRGPSIYDENRYEEVRDKFAERILSWSPTPQGYRGPEIWAIVNNHLRGIANVNSDFKYIVSAEETISSRAGLTV